MRVALVQYNPKFGEKEKNLQRAGQMLERARFDLAVLPELFATGYLFVSKSEVRELSEPLFAGPTCRFVAALCRKKNAYLAFGILEREGNRYYNSALLWGPKGLLLHYRKIHLFYEEKKWFAPGNLPLSVARMGRARAGLMICFDWRFPEMTRALALKGAEVVLHPSNLVMPHGPDAMVTRALENRVFCATADRTGMERRRGKSFTYIGQSQVVDPDGKILKRLGKDEETVAVVEIDPSRARQKKLNAYNDVLKDRRPEAYA